MRTPARLISFIFSLLLWVAGSLHASTLVLIVSSERSDALTEVADVLVNELVRLGVSRGDIVQQTALEFQHGVPAAAPKLLVALGSQAARVVMQTERPFAVLCTLLPRNSFEAILHEMGQKPSDKLTALWLDQPLSRQLELIRVALPMAKNVGVLWGAESKLREQEFKALAASKQLSVVEGYVTAEGFLFAQLKKVLTDADVLLALADRQVFNTQTVQNILLSTFRAKVPVVGFSPAYVHAGALLAVFSTPEQVGRQAAALAKDFLLGKGLPSRPLHPSSFNVAVNDHVARVLGLRLDAQALTARLKSSEGLK